MHNNGPLVNLIVVKTVDEDGMHIGVRVQVQRSDVRLVEPLAEEKAPTLYR